MKIVAILIIGYFMMGFMAGGLAYESMHPKPVKPNSIPHETPPFQTPLLVLLLFIFLGLPILGYRRAKKQSRFLHIAPPYWLWGPPSLLLLGLAAGFIAVRFM